MERSDIREGSDKRSESFSFTHLAISTGSRKRVDELTAQLRRDGYRVVSEARTTGDGYYESGVEDCDGNLIEITD